MGGGRIDNHDSQPDARSTVRWLGFLCSLGLMRLFAAGRPSVEFSLRGVAYVDAPTVATGVVRPATEVETDAVLTTMRQRHLEPGNASEILIIDTGLKAYPFACSDFRSALSPAPDPRFQAELDTGLLSGKRGIVSLSDAVREVQKEGAAQSTETAISRANTTRASLWAWTLYHPGMDTLILAGHEPGSGYVAYLLFRHPSYARIAAHMPVTELREVTGEDSARFSLPSEIAGSRSITLLGPDDRGFLIAAQNVLFFTRDELLAIGPLISD